MRSSWNTLAASNSERGGAAPRARCAHILLVEDSPTDAMMVRETLSQVHVDNVLHVVEDGMQALQFLRRQGAYAEAPRPDLVLLDLQLPRKNGQEVLAEIKADEKLRAIPVIILSSSREERDIVCAYRAFANSYVTKPIDYQDFAEAMRLIDRFWLRLAVRPEDE